MSFLNILQDVMERLDLTQTELFDRTGLTRNNYEWWVKNPDTTPQPKTLRKIRKALGITFLRDPETKEITGWAVEHPTRGTNSTVNVSVDAPLPPAAVSDALSNSDEGLMVIEFNRLATTYGLRERWENLPEHRREAWRREYALMQVALRRVQAEHEQRLLEALIGTKEKTPRE